MHTPAFGRRILTAWMLLCGFASMAQAASVEALLAEINKLPAAARQKRLEEGARREGAFTYYSISNAELIGAYIKGFMNRYPFIKAEFYRGSGNQLVVRTMLLASVHMSSRFNHASMNRHTAGLADDSPDVSA